MIKCVIVDDEPLAQQIIAGHIQLTPNLQLVGICANAMEAFELIHQQQIDLLFLDIQMPVINGMDFIQSLHKAPAVIFTTAFAEYAVDSYEVNAVDYLLKPITYERFANSIRKFLTIHIPPEPEKNYAFFKVNGKFMKLTHAEIRYAQSIKDYVILHTSGGNYITHMTMKYLESLLPTQLFVRIHRSYLVNKQLITSMDKKEVHLEAEKLPVGRSYKQAINSIQEEK